MPVIPTTRKVKQTMKDQVNLDDMLERPYIQKPGLNNSPKIREQELIFIKTKISQT